MMQEFVQSGTVRNGDTDRTNQMLSIGELTAGDFQDLTGQLFPVDPSFFGISVDGTPTKRDDIYPAEADLDLKLVEVKRHDPMAPGMKEPFTLLFCGPHETPLFSSMHVVKHPSRGDVLMFLNPINAQPGLHPENHPDGRFYESIVN